MEFSDQSKSKNNNPNWKNLLLWVLIAVLIRWQLIEPRWIPSESMLPTLQINDRILVEKISPKINHLFKISPKREKIAIFTPPKSLIKAGYDSNQALIKRIVGIPGDKIEVKDGHLIRNEVVIKEPWILENIDYEMDEIIIPPDSLWVLGDNRNNSLDSHYWGFLPEENLVGTASIRYWPLQKFGPIRFPAT